MRRRDFIQLSSLAVAGAAMPESAYLTKDELRAIRHSVAHWGLAEIPDHPYWQWYMQTHLTVNLTDAAGCHIPAFALAQYRLGGDLEPLAAGQQSSEAWWAWEKRVPAHYLAVFRQACDDLLRWSFERHLPSFWGAITSGQRHVWIKAIDREIA